MPEKKRNSNWRNWMINGCFLASGIMVGAKCASNGAEESPPQETPTQLAADAGDGDTYVDRLIDETPVDSDDGWRPVGPAVDDSDGGWRPVGPAVDATGPASKELATDAEASVGDKPNHDKHAKDDSELSERFATDQRENEEVVEDNNDGDSGSGSPKVGTDSVPWWKSVPSDETERVEPAKTVKTTANKKPANIGDAGVLTKKDMVVRKRPISTSVSPVKRRANSHTKPRMNVAAKEPAFRIENIPAGAIEVINVSPATQPEPVRPVSTKKLDELERLQKALKNLRR